MSDRLTEIQGGYTKYTWIKMKLAVKDLLVMVGASNLAAEIFQADCEKKDNRIVELEALVRKHFNDVLNLDADLKKAEAQVDAVRRYSNKCAILRIEPTTAGLKKALQETGDTKSELRTIGDPIALSECDDPFDDGY